MKQMYFIAVVAPDSINSKVLKYKRYMKEKYGCLVGLKSPAHITLIPPFWFENEKEERLLELVDEIASQSKSFEIKTNDFSTFKPKTIFVTLYQSAELDDLKKISDEVILRYPETGCVPEKRLFHPHITIATRDLHKRDFYESWQLFEKKEFKEQWQVNEVSLLRHNKQNWDVVHTSQFRFI